MYRVMQMARDKDLELDPRGEREKERGQAWAGQRRGEAACPLLLAKIKNLE